MTGQLSRRQLLGGAGIAVATLAIATSGGSAGARPRYAVNLSEAEWRKRLGPAAYNVLRREATERAWTSPLLKEHWRGIFACTGCDQPLFRSQAKYDSGTGWPSFTAPIRGAVGTSTDRKIGIPRTEVHCRRCGGHLGHVFNDGPPPAGKRWCINGVSLRFKAASA